MESERGSRPKPGGNVAVELQGDPEQDDHSSPAGPPSRVQRALARCKAIGQVCVARPHVILVPLVICGLMMGLGVWGVLYAADAQASNSEAVAKAQVESAASSFRLTVKTVTTPVVEVTNWIRNTLDYRIINSTWEKRTKDWWPENKDGSLGLTLVPNGIMTNFLPVDDPEGPIFYGTDIIELYGDTIFAGITADVLTVLYAPHSPPDDSCRMHFARAINVYNTTADEDWHMPFNISSCPPGVCWNNATKTRWWGNIAQTVLCDKFLSSNGPLSQVMRLYSWQIWRPPSTTNPERSQVSLDDNVKEKPDNAVMATMVVADELWELYIWQEAGWEPNWKNPLIACVVVVSVVVGVLLFATLLSWAEHHAVLQTVLPQATIERLRTELDWQNMKKSQHQAQLVEIETPAQQMLTILDAFVNGRMPAMAMVLAVQRALHQSLDVYRPPTRELQSRMAATNMDLEARLALTQQLGQAIDMQSSFYCAYRKADAGEDEADGLDRASSISSVDMQTIMAGLMRPTKSLAAPASLDSASQSILGTTSYTSPFMTNQPDDNGPKSMIQAFVPGSLAGSKSFALKPKDEGLGEGAQPVPTLTMDRPIMDDVDRLLAQASDSWAFDTYALEEATQGHPLSVLGFWLLSSTGCMKQAGIKPSVLARFLRRVEAGYPVSNPYHNARHAADVLQTFHMIITRGGLAPGYVDQGTTLTCYLTAIIHDYEHRGLSTDFLTSSSDKLAVLYNDKSPMENHHLAAAWALMGQPEFNILANVDKATRVQMRKLVIELVLGTDMKQHFSIMGQFTAQHAALAEAASQRQSHTSAPMDQSNTVMLQPINDGERVLSLQMALKCADLGHLTKALPVHLRWVQALEEEFFRQGDEERARGMPLSPLCDRHKEGVTKSQVGFFDFVCVPLFTHFTMRFGTSRPLLTGLLGNYEHWKQHA